MISRGVEYFRQSWNTCVRSSVAFYSVGKLSAGLEYFLEIRNSFDRVKYTCIELEYLIQGWNALYRVEMLSTGLECVLQCWNTFVQS
jgi:hypothetical protein